MAAHFQGVVQPLDGELAAARRRLSWRAWRRAARRADRLRALLESSLGRGRGDLAAAPDAIGVWSPALWPGWLRKRPPYDPERACTAHIVVECPRFIVHLLEHAALHDDVTLADFYAGQARTRFLHLLDQHPERGLFLPVDFASPFRVRLPDLGIDLTVGSSQRLAAELNLLASTFGADLTRRLAGMKDFVHAQAKEFEGLITEGFWASFGYLVLARLAARSVADRLPLVLGQGWILEDA